MNDLLYVYLEWDPTDMEKNVKVETLFPRLDALLKEHGWEYTGMQNMYRPVKGTDPDDTYTQARQALKDAQWLKEYNPHTATSTWTNACELNEIVIEHAGDIDEAKLNKYREYYQKNHKFAHGIVVDDEEHVLLDGYTTYLIAKENAKAHPEIMQVRRGQVFRKIVVGKLEGEENLPCWYYDDGPAVCPGDVLVDVDGRQMEVDHIGYVAGKHACEKYKPWQS